MKKIDDIWKWGICMGTDIIGGEFLSEYVVREENQSMAAVNIIMDDESSYNVILLKKSNESEWSMDFPELQVHEHGLSILKSLSLKEKEDLKEKILNFNGFRLHFITA